MARHEDNGGPYGVVVSGAIADKLRELQRQATGEGRGKETVAAFRQIIRRLKQAPENFGEPLYRLPAMRVQVRCGSIRPLVVDFGVYEDRPLVFLKAVKLLARPGV